MELIAGKGHGAAVARLRPTETALFKALEIQPEPVAVPFQNLNPIPIPIAKHEKGGGEGIKAEARFHDSGQTVD